jgi:hypothetical protein
MIAPHDLVVLAADKDTEHTLRALLGRSRAMEIRAVSHDIKVHPNRDPGCIHADEFLRSFSRQFHHALVVFDREGCGVESSTREEIEGEVERRLRISGWDDRAAVVVLDPEIECWVWSESPHVDTALGWEKRVPPLRTWLMNKGLLRDGERKPGRPKEAMRAALREARIPPSASLFEQLASRVNTTRCVDPAFAKLRRVLNAWFPAAATGGS